MTGTELDAVLRYFGALFAKWPQSKAKEVLVAYGGRVKGFDQRDVREAIEELAEGSLLFPSVQEFVEACSIVKRRNLPEPEQPKRLTGPKLPPLQSFVRAMRDAGEARPVGPWEVRAFRMARQAPDQVAENVGALFRSFGGQKGGATVAVPLTDERYSSVNEFLAHEGYAVR